MRPELIGLFQNARAQGQDVEPLLTEVKPGRWVSCHLYDVDGVPA